jgi:hypothetical protein
MNDDSAPETLSGVSKDPGVLHLIAPPKKWKRWFGGGIVTSKPGKCPRCHCPIWYYRKVRSIYPEQGHVRCVRCGFVRLVDGGLNGRYY